MGGGGQGGCERRIEVIVKMQNEKKSWGGILFEGWGGGRRIEVFVIMQEKKSEVEEFARMDVTEDSSFNTF